MRGWLPSGPVTVMIHIASVWVPFTNESKEAIASYPEIQKELRLALQTVGRKLGIFMRRRCACVTRASAATVPPLHRRSRHGRRPRQRCRPQRNFTINSSKSPKNAPPKPTSNSTTRQTDRRGRLRRECNYRGTEYISHAPWDSGIRRLSSRVDARIMRMNMQRWRADAKLFDDGAPA